MVKAPRCLGIIIILIELSCHSRAKNGLPRHLSKNRYTVAYTGKGEMQEMRAAPGERGPGDVFLVYGPGDGITTL